MMKRVNILTEADTDDTEQEVSTVTIKTKEGDTFITTVAHPIGSSQNSLTRAQLKQKFSESVDHIMNEAQQQRALSYLERLEEVNDIRSVLNAFILELQKN